MLSKTTNQRELTQTEGTFKLNLSTELDRRDNKMVNPTSHDQSPTTCIPNFQIVAWLHARQNTLPRAPYHDGEP